jgi:16S rRNA (guanine527-N7)-methyltransferase
MDADLVLHHLTQGLMKFKLNLPIEPFFEYLALMDTWNRAYNLTAIQDPLERVGRHILDSLAIRPWLHGSRLIDVGTGAGLPGVPLAIARPQDTLVLLDSNGKKTRFLQEVKRVLSLQNVEIVNMRAEQYQPAQAFDTVMSRAFSELKQMVTWTEHLIAPEGVWLAMKGRYPTDELSQIHYSTSVYSYTVPNVDGERSCVIIKKKRCT